MIPELREQFKQFATLLEGMISAEPAKRAAMQAEIKALQSMLAGQNIDLEFDLSQLAENSGQEISPTNRKKLGSLAAGMRQAASDLDQPVERIDLDQILRSIEASLDPLLKLEKRKAREEEKKRREYKAHADDSIARSLRAFGFSTNRDDDNPDSEN